MIKDLKMELLNSEEATAIKGGELSGCDSAHAVIINCYVQLCSLIPPTPTPHKTIDILSIDASEPFVQTNAIIAVGDQVKAVTL